jgi:hypothetical protein
MQLGIFLDVPRTCAGSSGFPRRPDARKRPSSLVPADSSLRPSRIGFLQKADDLLLRKPFFYLQLASVESELRST